MDFPKSVPNIGLVNGQFADENVGTGQPGSLIPAVWGNSVTLEILSVLAAAGIVPDELKTNQLAAAISKIVTSGATWEKLGGKPTTIDGFGITDAMKLGAGGLATTLAPIAGKISDISANQFTSLGAVTTDKPQAISFGAGIHIKYPDSKFAIDFVGGIANEWYGVRQVLADGSGTWRALWHDGNFDPASKSNINSPSFTGAPLAPTAAAGTNNQQLANTAFVWSSIYTYATTVTAALSLKADKATTLVGYGIVAATSAEVVEGLNDSKPVTPLGVNAAIKAADPWAIQPIGVPIPVFDNLGSSLLPPLNKSYRYVTLTANDSYNTGVLTGEVVSGSAPAVNATAVVNSPGSPLHGRTINLVNTGERVLRGAMVAGQLLQDALQNITGSTGNNIGAFDLDQSGAFASAVSTSFRSSPSVSGAFAGTLSFDASRVARTANETRAKSIGVTYIMRVR